MKRIVALLTVILFSSIVSLAQDVVVSWNFSSKKLDSNRYEITASGNIPQGWYLYFKDSTQGLDPANFIFDYEQLEKLGNIVYTGTAQQLNDVNFGKQIVYSGAVQLKQVIHFTGQVLPSISGSLDYSLGKGEQFLGNNAPFVLQFEGATIKTKNDILLTTIDLAHPLAPCGDASIQDESLWMIFFLGFIGGLIGLLTPCVFPMIPVTVSLFTKRSGRRSKGLKNAVLQWPGCMVFLFSSSTYLPAYRFIFLVCSQRY